MRGVSCVPARVAFDRFADDRLTDRRTDLLTGTANSKMDDVCSCLSCPDATPE